MAFQVYHNEFNNHKKHKISKPKKSKLVNHSRLESIPESPSISENESVSSKDGSPQFMSIKNENKKLNKEWFKSKFIDIDYEYGLKMYMYIFYR